MCKIVWKLYISWYWNCLFFLQVFCALFIYLNKEAVDTQAQIALQVGVYGWLLISVCSSIAYIFTDVEDTNKIGVNMKNYCNFYIILMLIFSLSQEILLLGIFILIIMFGALASELKQYLVPLSIGIIILCYKKIL